MKYCKKCIMPDTRPGIKFNKAGICQGCVAEEKRNTTDWKQRYKELKKLCDKHRKSKGFDCVIAVSGGKDSHFQVYVMKELMGMHPLLVTVEDNFTTTKAGINNIRNMSEYFGCEIISMKPNIKLQKHLMRTCFEKWGSPTWYIDRLIYTFPMHIACNFNIPLVVYGENISYEYGGDLAKETWDASKQIDNDVARSIPFSDLVDAKDQRDLAMCRYPDGADKLEPMYLSYFMRWNSHKNYLLAKKLGFMDLSNEWDRSHCVDNYDQVDTLGYLVHAWMKYPKFGHTSATDIASRWVRYGMITRDKAIKLAVKKDSNLDQLALKDFCDFCGYSIAEFWNIVERFWNRDIFNKIDNEWVLKIPVGGY